MAQEEDGKIELNEAEIDSDSMVALRDAAFKRAFDKGYFASPLSSTTMEIPRYMAKYAEPPLRYEWLSRVVTNGFRLDKEGHYPSGLFKFVVTVPKPGSTPSDVQVEQGSGFLLSLRNHFASPNTSEGGSDVEYVFRQIQSQQHRSPQRYVRMPPDQDSKGVGGDATRGVQPTPTIQVRIEEDVLITEEGCEVLSDVPRTVEDRGVDFSRNDRIRQFDVNDPFSDSSK
ncbi:hypothetical protein TSMEX_003103 [Taenia solium]|eukprot:TsM_000677100 transcript=TsM_000677100 gene=TsM_000677100